MEELPKHLALKAKRARVRETHHTCSALRNRACLDSPPPPGSSTEVCSFSVEKAYSLALQLQPEHQALTAHTCRGLLKSSPKTSEAPTSSALRESTGIFRTGAGVDV